VYGAAQDGIWATYFPYQTNWQMLADYLGRSSCFKSPASPDPLAPEPEVTKPRAEGAKDEQQAERNEKNGKRQNEK
jgi:hypothetical protein